MSRESFCHNADGSPKGTFLDKRDAKRIARLVATRSSYQSEKGAMHLYHCPKPPVGCGLYHLGHDNDGGAAA
jgi:hypothetical protein